VSTVRPERKAVGVVLADNDGAVCTTGFAVLRPKNISPLLLAALLRSDFVTEQLMRNNIGIAYPAIDEKCLLDVVLPIDEGGAQTLSAIANSLEQLEQKLTFSRREFMTQVHQIADSPGEQSG
jgi:type I restriction enzyme S subunit